MFTISNTFVLLHDCRVHLWSIMISRIIENLNGHQLKGLNVLLNGEFSTTACYHDKLIVRPSSVIVEIEFPCVHGM